MRLAALEGAVRGSFSWALVWLFGGARRPALPDWKARPYRILVIRDDGVGDLIVSIEVLRAIRESSPTFSLDLLCSPANARLARKLDFVSEVIVHKREGLIRAIPTLRRLRRNRYDVVIDGRMAINNVNKHTTILMLATGAPWRIGVGGRTNDRVYSVPVRAERLEHWVDNIVALASPFGVKPDDRDWRAKLPLDDALRADAERRWREVGTGRPRILVNLYSAMADRLWPVDNFAPVLAHVRKRLPNATIVIPTMPSGDPVAERLVQPVHGAALPLDLDQLTAFTATADLVVSPDTAVTVIASAFHVPVLALMREGAHRWVPYRVAGLTVFSDDPRSLNQLPVERVIAGADQVIDTVGREHGWS